MGRRGRIKTIKSREDDKKGKCPHALKSVQAIAVQKAFPHLRLGYCKDCDGTPGQDENDNDESVPPVCICARCGYQACSRQCDKQHALKHYKDNPSHAVSINLSNWMVWCYDCDDELDVAIEGYDLGSLLKFLKLKIGKKFKLEDSSSTDLDAISAKSDQLIKTEHSSTAMDVKGLKNLGNTCFFNSVLQNMFRTDLLHKKVKEVFYDEKLMSLQFPAQTIEVKVKGPPGSLTKALSNILNEVSSGSAKILNPESLLGEVCKKAPQFKGYQQQDSQELLRYLLDSMRIEELQRVERALKVSVNAMDVRSQPAKDQIKRVFKGLKTFVDDIFGGVLVSSITCHRCLQKSRVYEDFLDLSLPVTMSAEKTFVKKKSLLQLAEESKVKSSGDEKNTLVKIPAERKLSKHQLKKNAKNERRAKRHRKLSGSRDGRQTINDTVAVVTVVESADALAVETEIQSADQEELLHGGAESANGDPLRVSLHSVSLTTSQVSDYVVIDSPQSEPTDFKLFSEAASSELAIPILPIATRAQSTSNNETVCKEVEAVNKSEQLECCDFQQYPVVISSNHLVSEYSQQDGCPFLPSEPSSPARDSNRDADAVLDKLVDSPSSFDNGLSKTHPTCVHDLSGIPCICSSAVGDQEFSPQRLCPSLTSDLSDRLPSDFTSLEDPRVDSRVACCCTLSDTRRSSGCEVPRSGPPLAGSNHSAMILPCGSGSQQAEAIEFSIDVVAVLDHLCEQVGSLEICNNEIDVPLENEESSSESDEDVFDEELETLAPAYEVKAGESSVSALLRQFCSVDVLEGNNLFSCDFCAKKSHRDAAGASKDVKQVLTEASKRLLISRPPAVLTLHLKRFAQVGGRNQLRKVSSHVDFPLELDLAPFCARDAKVHGRVVKYSLYGIVEHSGSLHSGHYVAYVKFKLRHTNNHSVSKSRWYYISDGNVSTIAEEQVLRKQAYLLFYELIQ